MGYLGYSPQLFYMCEPYELVKIIEKAKQRIEFEHRLQYIANINAIGRAMSKNYKYVDAFSDNKKKKTVTDDEREEMIEFLKEW